MKNINSTFKAEKNKAANRPVFLYTIYDYDGADTPLYFVEHEADVVFDGITYIAFPIKHDFISENSQGEIDTMKVIMSNVSRLVQGYLETYDFRGKKVSIKMVYLDHLDDDESLIEDIFYIDSYSSNEAETEFTLSSKFDILELELPGRRYMRGICSWKFKSTECAYAGAETTCNKTFQRCRGLQNQLRFGGFPSIPTERVYAG